MREEDYKKFCENNARMKLLRDINGELFMGYIED